MTTSKTTTPTAVDQADENVNLARFLSAKPSFGWFSVWLVGQTPLITHAWSEKAKREMLSKQAKGIKAGKDARDPTADYVASLYRMADDVYGFPAMGIKNCILSAAHKDKGLPRTTAQSAFWIKHEMVRVAPALAGAICDMPLVRIHGSPPQMREDMVRVGSGLNKTASLAYRAQFTTWAIRLEAKFNMSILNEVALEFLMTEAGAAYGIGEWRPEKKGTFGSFKIADAAETAAWDDFASGRGPLPMNTSTMI